ncbi:hypothetical protein DWG14_08384 [Streptomyces griseorubiginosus]|uniref:Uncharacterized protein n=1 Tax=Streptomyces griseorubiginosus TaxID=67304 RepID=A0AAI8PTA6_9ACTN|nr:hypothetical protein DWG14_08384 [Streptomyces griseorubiginosus]
MRDEVREHPVAAGHTSTIRRPSRPRERQVSAWEGSCPLTPVSRRARQQDTGEHGTHTRPACPRCVSAGPRGTSGPPAVRPAHHRLPTPGHQLAGRTDDRPVHRLLGTGARLVGELTIRDADLDQSGGASGADPPRQRRLSPPATGGAHGVRGPLRRACLAPLPAGSGPRRAATGADADRVVVRFHEMRLSLSPVLRAPHGERRGQPLTVLRSRATRAPLSPAAGAHRQSPRRTSPRGQEGRGAVGRDGSRSRGPGAEPAGLPAQQQRLEHEPHTAARGVHRQHLE